MSRVVIGIVKRETPEPAWLLVSSKKDFGEFTGYYYPPGGHVEEGETDEEALAREMKEELQLTVEVMDFLHESEGDISGQCVVWFQCSTIHTNFLIDSEELSDAGFFTQAELQQMNLWPATKNIFHEFIFKKE